MVILLFVVLKSNAQYRIEGHVVDSASLKPLVGVNIFLSHTTIGINSNDKGDFQLGNLKQGKYELVISSLNYEDYIIPIQINQKIEPFLIKLKPSANILKEVVVESYDPKGWYQWGDQFKQNFMGAPILARNCILLNPEVVKFKFNPKTNKPLVDHALIYALYWMGYKNRMTVHGFRAIASTVLNENEFRPDVIERQLAHTDTNQVRRAYNRAQYLNDRIALMNWWGDYLEKMTPFKVNLII